MSGDQQQHDDIEVVNAVIVGDNNVGKTNLILSYATDNFSLEHVPTVFDHFSCDI